MPSAIFPDPRFRSPTAQAGVSDFRDENVYSAVVLQTGGSGVTKIFVSPAGQSIPSLAGATVATPAQLHQQKYSDLTTNLAKAGELGSALGEAEVRAIGVVIEQAAYAVNAGGGSGAAGSARAFGATQFEVADILSKVSLEFKVGGKRQIIGAINMFPAYGGASGSVATTGNAVASGIATNGWPGTLRRLKFPIAIARNDQIECAIATGNGVALAFNTITAGTDGQPSLCWVNLHASISGDVR